MRKRLICCVLLTVLLTTIGANATATRWSYTCVCEPELKFTGTTAICSLVIQAISGSATITATLKLIRINANGTETTLRTWPGLTGTGRLVFSDTYTVTRGLTYRLEVSARVSTPQGSENINTFVTARCP